MIPWLLVGGFAASALGLLNGNKNEDDKSRDIESRDIEALLDDLIAMEQARKEPEYSGHIDRWDKNTKNGVIICDCEINNKDTYAFSISNVRDEELTKNLILGDCEKNIPVRFSIVCGCVSNVERFNKGDSSISSALSFGMHKKTGSSGYSNGRTTNDSYSKYGYSENGPLLKDRKLYRPHNTNPFEAGKFMLGKDNFVAENMFLDALQKGENIEQSIEELLSLYFYTKPECRLLSCRLLRQFCFALNFDKVYSYLERLYQGVDGGRDLLYILDRLINLCKIHGIKCTDLKMDRYFLKQELKPDVVNESITSYCQKSEDSLEHKSYSESVTECYSKSGRKSHCAEFQVLNELENKKVVELDIVVLGGNIIYLSNSLARIAFEIRNNGEKSVRIKKISVILNDSKDSIRKDDFVGEEILVGGNSSELLEECVVKVDNSFKNIAFAIEFTYCYDSIDVGETKNICKEFSLAVTEFKQIYNPYAKFSAGGPVSGSMFIGRENEINNLVAMLKDGDSLLTKRGIIIYGQKRAGKSSILQNLKSSIENAYGVDAYLFVDVGSIGKLIGGNISSVLCGIYEKMIRSFKKNYPEIYKQLLDDEWKDVSTEMLNRYKGNNDVAAFVGLFEDVFERLENLGGLNKYIPMFLIDEFTYLYGEIEKGKVQGIEDFPKFWKAFLQDYNVCSIVVGLDNAPAFINDARYANDFACMKLFKVTYLTKRNATKLIKNPTGVLRDGNSIFVDSGDVDMMYRLTAGSAHYIVYLCDKLIDYMNENLYGTVTKIILNNFLLDLFNNKLVETNIFDPLVGDPNILDKKQQKIVSKDNEKILEDVALKCNKERWTLWNDVGCDKLSSPSQLYRDQLISDLITRDVLDLCEENSVKCVRIKVDLCRIFFANKAGIWKGEI